jgi:hypothetical protein
MRKVCALLLCLVPLPVALAQGVELKEYQSPDGLFTVLLPGKPAVRESVLMGKKMHSYGAVVGLEGSFAINVAPSTFLAGTSAEDVARHLESTVKELKCDIAESKKIMIGKHAGQEVRGTFKDKKDMALKVRALVVGDKLVQIMVRGQKSFVDGVQAKRVFDSFTLKP